MKLKLEKIVAYCMLELSFTVPRPMSGSIPRPTTTLSAGQSTSCCCTDQPGSELHEHAEFVAWCKAEAEAGQPNGMHSLACSLADGRGCERDQPAAVQWWQKAAEAGYVPSMLCLAQALEGGAGCDVDIPKAMAWRLSAARDKSSADATEAALLSAARSGFWQHITELLAIEDDVAVPDEAFVQALDAACNEADARCMQALLRAVASGSRSVPGTALCTVFQHACRDGHNHLPCPCLMCAAGAGGTRCRVCSRHRRWLL